jgi:hypothetical protein
VGRQTAVDIVAASSIDGDSDILVGRLTADDFRLLCQAKAALVLSTYPKPDAESFRSVADSVLDPMCALVASGPQHDDADGFIADLLTAAGELFQTCSQRSVARTILQNVCEDWLADDWGDPEPYETGEVSEEPTAPAPASAPVLARHIDEESFKDMCYEACMGTFYLHSEEHVQQFKSCALTLVAKTRQVLSEIKDGEEQDNALADIVEACEHLLPSGAALAVFQDVVLHLLLDNGPAFGLVAGRAPHHSASRHDAWTEEGGDDSPDDGCMSDYEW